MQKSKRKTDTSLSDNPKEKGITIFLSVIIMSILLAIISGATIFLIDQMKMAKDSENSISAFYAADSGIEQALNAMMNGDEMFLQPVYLGNFGPGNASYEIHISCCIKSAVSPNCDFYTPGGEDCFIGAEDPNCPANRYCIRSIGTFGGTRRAIETYY